jgi:hypothetical protein
MTSVETIRRLFVVSTGRTGTQFLARFFSELGADARHEPGPFWLRNLSNAYVSGHFSHARARRILLRKRPAAEGRLYVESSCLVYGLVRPICDAFPDARVVHIVRDPRTYVRSAMDWGVHRLAGRPLNLVPFRRLSPAHYNPWSPKARLEWALSDQFERVCWNWLALNRAIRLQGEGQRRFIVVRFEDIFERDRGYPGLRAIAEFTGVEAPDGAVERFGSLPVNVARRREFPPWSDWSPSMRQRLLEVCGEEAARYQYRVDL